jgi:Asp-tRNA(Asn)/Glu-tRNA(Gln) amidotransferase A subunit family amidase
MSFSTLRGSLVFPIQICSIIAPIQVVAFTLLLAPTMQAYSTVLMPLLPTPDPCATAAGLPIGLFHHGAHGQDAALVAVAKSLEEMS